jgi:uncharacterized protein involved in type VI secretion and phage assembly
MASFIESIGSVVSQLVNFSSDTRLYDIDTPLGEGKLMVESWVAREALSSLYEFRITCLSTDTHIELKSLMGQQVTLKTRLADGSIYPRTGRVRQFRQLGSDGGLARFQLIVVPWLWMATMRITSRVFQEQTLLQIIETVLADETPFNNWRVTPDAQQALNQLPVISYCCQYRETNYAFVSRMLAEYGIGFFFEEDPDGNSASKQRLVLFDDSTQFTEDYSSAHANGGQGIRFHRHAAVEVQDTIQQFGSEVISQPEITSVASWDYKSKRVNYAEVPTIHRNDHPPMPPIESHDWQGMYASASQADAQQNALLRREALDARTETFLGMANTRTFQPGHDFTLTHSPLDGLAAFAAKDPSIPTDNRFTLTGTLQAGVNNLPSGIKEGIAHRLGTAPSQSEIDRLTALHDQSASNTMHNRSAGLQAREMSGAARHLDQQAWDELLDQAKESSYANRFTAIRAHIKWRPMLDDGTGALMNPKPTALGPQTAIVVGADGSTADAGHVHTDNLGRIRIRFHWQTGESNTCWVRVAQMFAGPGYGAQFIPRIGQEVLVKFFGNDIDRPIVNGVLYNGQGQDDPQALAAASDHNPAGQDNKIGNGASPAWFNAGEGGHNHAGYLSGFKSVPLGCDGYSNGHNTLGFDDSTGRLRLQMATSTASTQLNFGHLIHQADNFRGSFRGTGWELRTDAYGAIRGGKGILISTYYGTTPDGKPEPAGENTAGIALMKQAQGFADTFNGAASTHQTVQMLAAKGDKTLNQGNGESALDDKLPPLKAMVKAISGQVSAQDGSEGGTGKKIPHSTAPIITVAAQAGLGMTASDGLHYAAGEAAHFASGRDTHIAVGEALTMHSGQAIGILAGAVGADVHGIQLIAGQGDIDLQAQADMMTFASKELMRLISANSHIDFAAAKSIELCTEGGASLKIEGGNITFSCPGMITIKASSKSFGGPASQNYALPRMPTSTLPDVPIKFNMLLTDMPGPLGVPLAHMKWRIVHAPTQQDAHLAKTALLAGETGPDGKITLTTDQEKLLAAAYRKSPSQIWLAYGGQIKSLQLAQTQKDWSDRDKFYHALDAMGYSDQLYLAQQDDVDNTVGARARQELKSSSGATVLNKLKA